MSDREVGPEAGGREVGRGAEVSRDAEVGRETNAEVAREAVPETFDIVEIDYASGALVVDLEAIAKERMYITPYEAFQIYRQNCHLSRLATGIAPLDAAIGGGLPVGQLTVLGGYTGAYKSDTARQIAINCARRNVNVVYADVELGTAQIVQRTLAQLGTIPFNRLQGGKLDEGQKDRFLAASEELCRWPMRMLPATGIESPDKLESEVKKALGSLPKSELPPLVILDSLQRLSLGVKHSDRRLQVDNFVVWAEQLSKRLKAAVILVTEFKRASQGGVPGPDETLTAGAETRAIEFTAALFMGLAVDGKLSDKIVSDADSEVERVIKVIIAKNRAGLTGSAPVDFVYKAPYWQMYTETPHERAAKEEDKLIESVFAILGDGEVHTGSAIAKQLGKRKSVILDILREMEARLQVEQAKLGSKAVGYKLALGDGDEVPE